MKKYLNLIIKFAIFGFGLALVIVGQKTIDYPHALMMLIGLAMLLSLIYMYNKKYNH